MTLLIDIHNTDWMAPGAFRNEIPGIADAELSFYPDIEEAGAVTMLVTDSLRPGLAGQLPNLQLVQKLGAGVDTMVCDPELPGHVRITRLRHSSTAKEMARFCLAYVLKDVQNIDFHKQCQDRKVWEQIAPKRVSELRVGVLGLGFIGATVANMFAAVGFNVSGWSR